MHRVIDRKKVNWESASCRGLDTELFFKSRTELLEEGLSYGHLRRMCFSCPIWEECLRVGVQYEQFGFWGGLSEDERRHIYSKKFGSKVISLLMRDLAYLQVAFGEITHVVLDNERDFTFNK